MSFENAIRYIMYKLNVSWLELGLMLIISIAIITLSTYLHELGHLCKIKKYCKNDTIIKKSILKVHGIYGITKSDYYDKFIDITPEQSEELRYNMLAGVKCSVFVCLIAALITWIALSKVPASNSRLRLWLMVILVSLIISIELQLLNKSDLWKYLNNTPYQTPKEHGIFEGWLLAFICAISSVLASVSIQLGFQIIIWIVLVILVGLVLISYKFSK